MTPSELSYTLERLIENYSIARVITAEGDEAHPIFSPQYDLKIAQAALVDFITTHIDPEFNPMYLYTTYSPYN